MRAASPLRVIGIDPGTRVVGYGVIEVVGGRDRIVAHGALRAPAAEAPFERLGRLAKALTKVIATHAPTEAGIEEAFHGRDARAALRIGEARGALVSVLAQAGIPVTGYANNVVKKAVTGAGRAPKDQVQAMLQRIFSLDEPPTPFDAADALAVALCHLQHRGSPRARVGGAGAFGRGVSPRIAEALRKAGLPPGAARKRR